MKTEYGIPAPRGVRKDWEANSMCLDSAGALLRKRFVPEDWGDPTNCVAWFDRFGRARVIVGRYSNGREALVRADANGNCKTTFGLGAAPVDTDRQAKTALAGSGRSLGSAVGEAEAPCQGTAGAQGGDA